MAEKDFGFVADDDFGFEADIGFEPEPRGAGESFVAGLRGEPSRIAESPREFVTETIPQSAGRLTAGIPQFIQEIGKVPFNIAKTATDPLFHLATREPRKALESIPENVRATAEQANQLAKGLIEFGAKPFGVKPFAGKGEDVISIQNLKEAYGAEPIEALFGLLLARGAAGKARTPKPIEPSVAGFRGIGKQPKSIEPTIKPTGDLVLDAILRAETPVAAPKAISPTIDTPIQRGIQETTGIT